MSALLDWPGAEVVALVLIVVGVFLMLRGLYGVFVGFRRTNDIMTYLLSFRVGVIGLAIAGVGAAWLWHAPWVLAVALGVGLLELRESSSYIRTIRRRRREQVSVTSARPM